MAIMHLPCPRCGEEIEVLMEFDAGSYDIGIFPSWSADGFVAPCGCNFTPEQDEALSEAANERANSDPGFGVTHWESE